MKRSEVVATIAVIFCFSGLLSMLTLMIKNIPTWAPYVLMFGFMGLAFAFLYLSKKIKDREDQHI
jgi:hypothetical protein